MKDNLDCLWEGQTAVRQRGQQRAEEELTFTLKGVLVQRARRRIRETKTGAWLTVQPSTLNGMELGRRNGVTPSSCGMA